ncbi:unnamed protein product, partial [Meganyctiphanes norvegica]
GHCALDEEPVIFTYEYNTNNIYNTTPTTNVGWPPYTYGNEGYQFIGDGYFVLSQSGLNILGEFGVYANFSGCEHYTDLSCINGLTYYEPGITVTLSDTTKFLNLSPGFKPQSLGAIKV